MVDILILIVLFFILDLFKTPKKGIPVVVWKEPEEIKKEIKKPERFEEL